MSNLFNKTLSNISKKHAIFSILILIFYFIIWLSGLTIDDYKKTAAFYPVGVFYLLSPFMLSWSLVKTITYRELEVHLGTYEQNRHNLGRSDIFQDYQGGGVCELILMLENDIECKLIEYKRKLNVADLSGKTFSTVAVTIPVITWLYAISLYDDEQKLQNLWALTFSSMTAGFLFLTIGVTLLRHSKTIQENILTLADKLFFLRKVRIVTLSLPDESENKEIYTRVYKRLIFETEDEKSNSIISDGDSNSDLLKVYELVSKLQAVK